MEGNRDVILYVYSLDKFGNSRVRHDDSILSRHLNTSLYS